MVTFNEAKKTDARFECDHCHITIEAKDVELADPAENIHILTPPLPFCYVDKDGEIIGGQEQPSKAKGDKLLTCPYCKTPHIFGLERI